MLKKKKNAWLFKMNLDNHVELIQNPNPFLSFLSRKSPIPTLVNIFNNFEKMSQVITRKLAGYPTTISLHKNKKLKSKPTKLYQNPFISPTYPFQASTTKTMFTKS